MATVSGQLKYVTQRPDSIDEVWVRAPEVRGHSGGLITRNPDRYKVTAGQVSFEAAPGPAILVMVSAGDPVDSVKMFVGAGSSQTLEAVVKGADLLDENTVSELDRVLREIQQSLNSAADSVSKAKASETNAAGSASRASSSASSASTSASAAKTSETNAASSASAAKADADRAESAKTSAASSASAAKTSENAAKSHADRAGRIAESTSWSGDRLTVNGKTSPSLTGPKGDPGPKGQDGEVKFESLTQAQKETLRGPAGVVISETEPADKNVIWIQPGGEKFEVLGNSHTVMTDAEAEAVSEFLPKGFYIYVINSDRRYEVV